MSGLGECYFGIGPIGVVRQECPLILILVQFAVLSWWRCIGDDGSGGGGGDIVVAGLSRWIICDKGSVGDGGLGVALKIM